MPVISELYYLVNCIFGKQIVLEVKHGLCNRLCALISAQVAAREKNKRLKLIWRKNNNCGCDFSDLFNNEIERADENSRIDFNDDNNGDRQFLVGCKTMFYTDPFFKKFLKKDFSATTIHNKPFFSGVIDASAKLFHSELNKLIPKKEITDRVMEIPSRTVGIHLRKLDHMWISHVDDDWFIQKMEDLIRKDENIKFFLVTDDYRTKAKFIDRFGDKILYYDINLCRRPDGTMVEKKEKRAETKGVQDALLEFLTLSKTSLILGSYNSSFSWLASIRGLIPLEHSEKIRK